MRGMTRTFVLRRSALLACLLFLFGTIIGIGSTAFVVLGLVPVMGLAVAYGLSKRQLAPNDGFYVSNAATGRRIKWADYTYLH